MKRPITLIAGLLLFQIVKAASPSVATTNPGDLIQQDTVILPVVNQPTHVNYEGNVYKRRLDSITKDVPLDYNDYVQSYIDIYAHNRGEMAQVLGRTKYYFPIYEKAFRDAGIPEEIKYLSIVESKLDPYAVSRVGATGLWQFMFTTGKLYGLNIDDYVDDRRDPIQASYAAAAYIKDAYEEFGDWLLAIASYNCGTSNVEHAIEKAGASDFWSIRPFLPPETRNYVPAFIAVAYVMNYYDKLDIVPQPCDIALKTDTVMVNKYVSLGSIAQALGVNIGQLTILNPAYKRMIVNGTATAPRRLVLPEVEKTKYAALYNVLNNTTVAAPPPVPAQAPYRESNTDNAPLYHKIRRGETLRDIADNYGLTVQDLKVWNHLHGFKARVGEKLRLREPAEETASRTTLKHNHNYITYRVKKGDTLSGIASKFEGASVERIRSENGLKKNELQPGMTIRIARG